MFINLNVGKYRKRKSSMLVYFPQNYVQSCSLSLFVFPQFFTANMFKPDLPSPDTRQPPPQMFGTTFLARF